MSLGERIHLFPIGVAMLIFAGVFSHTHFGEYYLSPDGAVYLYGGHLLTVGKSPYLHMWDIKPPAVYILTAVTGAITTTPESHKILTAILTGGVAVTLVGLISGLSLKLTESRIAASVAGLSILTYAPFTILWAGAPYTKYFGSVCILIGMIAVLEKRWVWVLPAAAAAPLFWQFFAPVSILFGLVFLLCSVRSQVSVGQITKSVFGSIVLIGLVIAPIAFRGAIDEMLWQTVLIPLFVTTPGGGWGAFEKALPTFWPLVLIGIVGISTLSLDLATSKNTEDRGVSILIIGAILWFSIGGFLMHQLGRPDVIPMMCLFAVGVGWFAHRVEEGLEIRLPEAYFSKLPGLVILTGLGMTAVALLVIVTGPTPNPHGLSEAFLNNSVPNQCHIRWSLIEEMWVEQHNIPKDAYKCNSSGKSLSIGSA